MMNKRKKAAAKMPPTSASDKTTIRLNDAERYFFLALLNSDEEPNEALKLAGEQYRQGKREGDTYRW